MTETPTAAEGGKPRRRTANLPGAQGIQVGDHNTQINNFYARTPARGSGPVGPVCSVPPLRGEEVDRPELRARLVAAVLAPDAGSVGVSTGLVGAGGFGKSTLAKIVAHDPRVVEHFPDGRIWVNVGADTTGPGLAALITSTARLLDPTVAEFTDPLAAGAQLGRALDERRVLLVIDDVWSPGQVEPFQLGGSQTVRLFTTRQHSVLPDSGVSVLVDQMTASEAQSVLTAGLPLVPAGLVKRARQVCGSWPVLLALVHGAVRDGVRAGADAAAELADVLAALRRDGVTVLDVTKPHTRGLAVARTIEVSLDRLSATERDRYFELAVFGKDSEIPGEVVARLWAHTGGWSAYQSRRFCQRLADLALLAGYRRQPDRLQLHDVIRAYLRQQTTARHDELNRAVIDSHRDLVTGRGGRCTWADLDAEQSYLWFWLASHLRAGGLREELAAVLDDPHWLVCKLDHIGPAGLEADLLLSERPRHQALAAVIRQNAHVLGPLDPPGSLAATLASRIPDNFPNPHTRPGLLATINSTYLMTTVEPPDLPHPDLNRVLTCDADALVVAPDGSWLASASLDTVQIWDPATGSRRHTLTGHTDTVDVLVVAPDGSWLASAGYDRTVQIWDPATGQHRYTLTGHTGAVRALVVAPDGSWLASLSEETVLWDPATGRHRHTLTDWVEALVVAPDGSWLASASDDHTVRIWDPATGRCRRTLTGHTEPVGALVVAPDGAWLASACHDGPVRIWDPATGRCRRTLTGHTGRVWALVVAPDGSWLASASRDNTVRIWHPATGQHRHILTGHTHTRAMVVAPDGSWLASASWDNTVRIWHPDTIQHRHTLTGHTDTVCALVVAPDGSWLASASDDRTVRIWDPAVGRHRRTLTGHTGMVMALAVAPDGSWLASAGFDNTVRIWDPATGRRRHTLTGHTNMVRALVAAPDGSWLASASDDHTARIWDPATGQHRQTLTGHASSEEVLLVAPDGSWLASVSEEDGKVVRIWDTLTGRHRTLTGHAGIVTRLAVAPDGSWLASAGWDNTVRIWDPATRQHRHTLTGHTDTVRALVAAPDGSWLASASDDHTARIWDPTTGQPVASLRVGHPLTVAVWKGCDHIIVAGDRGPYVLSIRSTCPSSLIHRS